MGLQNPPTAFDRIILAMIGRVIGQPHAETRLLHKLEDALHELRPPTMVLWPIIQIDDQHADMPKALTHRFPPAHQTIDHTITRDFGGNPIQKQFIPARQEEPDGCYGRDRLEVMVGRLGWDAALPAPCEWANFDGRFRIDRDAQHRRVGIRRRIDLGYLVEDSVGFGDFFWG